MPIPKLFLLAALTWLTITTTGNVYCDEVRFNRDVLPILAENCFACHGFDSASREADLRLDTPDGLISGQEGSGVVVPGDPEASELVSRINDADPDVVMPPPETGKKLSEAERSLLRRWVEEGAKYEPHWSFVAPEKVEPPSVPGTDHPIDRFIQAQFEPTGLRPAAIADRETLIRRVSLDLIGLPPTIEQIDAFLEASKKDENQAYLDLVDRLLQDPHYGERWGRWWLDQARYADSNGYSIDAPRSIWKYRDWVVQALNADLPFDQFTIEQLAGDLLPEATVDQKVATGFHRNTQINQEGGIDKEQFRIDSVFDRVATTGTVWLGLTIGCAQCHDHKFDPITQEDFYRLFAFFNNQDEPSIKVYPEDVDVQAVQSERESVKTKLTQWLKDRDESLMAWEKELSDEDRKGFSKAIGKILDAEPDKRNFEQRLSLFEIGPGAKDDEFRTIKQQYDDLGNTLDRAPTTMVLQERAEPRKSFILIKGDFTRRSEEVTPGTPAVLHPFDQPDRIGNRLDLAKWLVRPDNPLTARVISNRLWQQYFGRGLVATENDFGLVGDRPSHADLLDWLANEFIARGWSLKSMHRLIVTSHTYRQSSRLSESGVPGNSDSPSVAAIDPENLLLAHQNRLRLDAELVRDVALTASGLLSDKLGGPPVYPPIPDGVMGQGQVKRAWNVSEGDDRYRRGLYTFIYRGTPPPSLNVFDAPDGFSTCTRRNRSNTPLQSLTLMNDSAFFEFAVALEQIVQDSGVETAFRRCTGRFPTAKEVQILEKLDSLTAARAMLNLDETITRE